MRRCGPILRLALATALLAGCTVGPDYEPPLPPKGATAPLAEATPALVTAEDTPDAWWRLYDDPRLDRLIAEAFAANTDLRAAEAHLAAARAIFEAARSQQFPSTKAEAGGVYGRDPSTNEIREYVGAEPKSDWIFDSLFDVAYEVDLFGRVRRSMEAAEANSEASAAARDALKVTVAAETARGFAQLCALGEELGVARRSLAITSHEAEITADRRAAGANSALDLARAEGLVAQVRAQIPPLEGQRRAALYQLTALLGRTPAEAPKDLDDCALPPHLAARIPAGDGVALLKRRPDVRAAERQLGSATAQIGVATADLWPRISLTGFWGGVGDKIDQLETNSAFSWGVGPSVSWAFPNQTGPRARIHQAEAGAQQALAQFDGAVLQALKETAQALAAYSAELDHRSDLAEFQEKERQAFGLAHDQFVAGSVGQLDLLTTEQTLVAADAAVAASDAAIAQDQIAVFKALGGGWKGEGG
jgi:NodT family efflux transporter outer membrane factor (OMF) lipoprotein